MLWCTKIGAAKLKIAARMDVRQWQIAARMDVTVVEAEKKWRVLF
jgi:hypothetical protein